MTLHTQQKPHGATNKTMMYVVRHEIESIRLTQNDWRLCHAATTAATNKNKNKKVYYTPIATSFDFSSSFAAFGGVNVAPAAIVLRHIGIDGTVVFDGLMLAMP